MTQIFSHIIPNVENWPVADQSRNRAEFIVRLNKFVIDQLQTTHKHNLHDLISKTIYMENQRIKLTPWKVDPPDEKAYWKSISNELEGAATREDKIEVEQELLKRIINRYNEEIVGHFMPKTFLFSRIFLTSFFKRIFNRYFASGQWRWGNKKTLQQKIKVKGNVELIRTLFEKGTVVILPTHYSNLDSIMVGYAIDANVGLPSFSYGAGLNLYNVEIVAYFINRLGAFRVDRRKKNPIYLECLKSMTGYSLIEGVNCLFFPGGTRSRSGQTEDKLKLGLISSVIEAQRLHLENNNEKKIFVVPLNLGYHFVLEASHLIDQHLQLVGKDKYKRTKGGGPSFANVVRFIKDLYTKSSEMYMSFGDPLDVFGNKVDADGISYDKFNHVVEMKDYFTIEGELSSNSQREGVYAKILGETVVDSYKKFNVILSSNVVAFVAFHLIYEEYKESGLLHLVNQRNFSFAIDNSKFEEHVGLLLNHIVSLSTQGVVTISDESWSDVKQLIHEGLSKLGIYHAVDILKKDKTAQIICQDIRQLYFYHNRLLNYGFEEFMGWEKV
ncbi:MAG: 1-acyl-sn-glycerol-3-phosphate acyltransferase [Saprospiraceae bacterium]|nr:1-acyl-sn-glycerol-3-phosphate acyltransferase [Saprospiraceae bacterium]